MALAGEPEPTAIEGRSPARPHNIVWRRRWVQRRPAYYATVGEGMPVVFLHGWGLGHHTYREAMRRLAGLGCRVFAPALPGFGGTADLPRRRFSLAGYAEWLAEFVDTVEVDEPVLTIGHSFGGGVAIRFAHDHPDRVRSLVLVNSIGGSAWRSGSTIKSMADRPLWDWGLHFPSDIWPIPQATKVLPVILEDAVANLVRNPRAIVRVGRLARTADLTAELEVLKQRGLPVVVLWGKRDGVIPRESFEALCAAVGAEGQVVDGSHSWLLANPDSFGEVITNTIEVARLAREMETAPAPRRRRFLGREGRRPRELRTIGAPRTSTEDGDTDADAES